MRNIEGKDEIIRQIEELKFRRKAVILAHNYQRGEVQDIADLVGDSLDLSRSAQKTDAEVIVFCGVHFMAEIAKILSPEKTVLLPDINSGCPLADTITPDDLKKLKKAHPEAIVVSYVNTSAEIKALSDICCTSANGIKVINSLPKDKEIIFTPDRYLGGYIAKQTKRELILWQGFCPTHLTITVDRIRRIKEKHPHAEVVVHPECRADVIEFADAARGTIGMCQYVKESSATEFIIGTENGIIHRLKKENPQKMFYPASEDALCPNMKLTTLNKILYALKEDQYKIEVSQDVAKMAESAILKMLAI